MKVLRKVREHLFVLLVASAYLILFFVRPDLGISGVKNSVYYIKEMILIMPVIFVLTALLDLWVPKQQIMRYLGKEAKGKGAVLSLVLGSISAGPIYAAFPLCVMLHKKGASIRNLVIILSAWAVIKVPMLLNEMKFLGLEFMAVRWVLTVIAILLFSQITAKLVQEEDLPHAAERPHGLLVDRAACMGCALCVKAYAELFELQQQKVFIKPMEREINQEKLTQAINACPVGAIIFAEESDQYR